MPVTLIGYTIRSVLWKPFILCTAVAWAACVVIGMPDQFDMSARFLVARSSLLVLALPLAFALDDDAFRFTASLPSRLWRRRAHRFGVIAVPWAATILAALLLAARGLPTDPDNPFPFPRLTTEAVALGAVAVFIAAAFGRHRAHPGRPASTLLIMLGLGIAAVPPPMQPWMTPFDPQFTGMGIGAWWFLAVVLVGLSAGLSLDSRTRR